MVKEAIRHAAGYTKFTTDTSRLFELESDLRHPHAWSAAAVEERFQPDLFGGGSALGAGGVLPTIPY